MVLIYDSDEETAWFSLLHETTEWRVKGLIAPYRRLVNKLIEALEDELYARKEQILDQVVKDFVAWKEFEQASAPTEQAKKKEE